MADLQHLQAKICYTVGTQIFFQGKILLVKHKKLQIWLPPGGHVEVGELPHLAAEREALEETGLSVVTYSPTIEGQYSTTEYLPNPILSNIHWISQENYQQRMADPEHYQPKPPWTERGCEQHHIFIYAAYPVGDTKPTRNLEETDGIGWFSPEEITDLDTPDSIKAEIAFGFKTAGEKSRV